MLVSASPGAASAAGSGATPVDGTPVCGTEAPATTTAPGPDPGGLRVATFNLLHSLTEEGDETLEERLLLTAQALLASGADVVGTQEVTRNEADDGGPQRHGMVAQRLARALAEGSGNAWHWCWFLSNPHFPAEPDVSEGGGGPISDEMAEQANFPEEGDFREGLAVLSRFPIEEARSRRMLPRSYESAACIPPDPLDCNFAALFESRQVLYARIATPTGGVDLFDVHLAHGITALSDTSKLLQVHQVLAVVDEWSRDDPLPDVVVGDFNSTPGSDRYQVMSEASFADSYLVGGGVECSPAERGVSGCTSDVDVVRDEPTQSPETLKERIDYVWARPGSCGLSSSEALLLGAEPTLRGDGTWLWPSDHLGVAVTLGCEEVETAGSDGGERGDGGGGDAADGGGEGVAARASEPLPASGASPAWMPLAVLALALAAAAAARPQAIVGVLRGPGARGG